MLLIEEEQEREQGELRNAGLPLLVKYGNSEEKKMTSPLSTMFSALLHKHIDLKRAAHQYAYFDYECKNSGHWFELKSRPTLVSANCFWLPIGSGKIEAALNKQKRDRNHQSYVILRVELLRQALLGRGETLYVSSAQNSRQEDYQEPAKANPGSFVPS